MRRDIFTEEHDIFREQCRRFVETEIVPKLEQWKRDGITDRETWRLAGEQGFLGANAPRSTAGRGPTSSTTPSSWKSWRASAATT